MGLQRPGGRTQSPLPIGCGDIGTQPACHGLNHLQPALLLLCRGQRSTQKVVEVAVRADVRPGRRSRSRSRR
eukprot:7727238-Pyramimonas_sp.AAC.1